MWEQKELQTLLVGSTSSSLSSSDDDESEAIAS